MQGSKLQCGGGVLAELSGACAELATWSQDQTGAKPPSLSVSLQISKPSLGRDMGTNHRQTGAKPPSLSVSLQVSKPRGTRWAQITNRRVPSLQVSQSPSKSPSQAWGTTWAQITDRRAPSLQVSKPPGQWIQISGRRSSEYYQHHLL